MFLLNLFLCKFIAGNNIPGAIIYHTETVKHFVEVKIEFKALEWYTIVGFFRLFLRSGKTQD